MSVYFPPVVYVYHCPYSVICSRHIKLFCRKRHIKHTTVYYNYTCTVYVGTNPSEAGDYSALTQWSGVRRKYNKDH